VSKLQAPNLDDRTFQDIVNEAIKLIPRYCPKWTNYNPGDPGITLIELFAWMTELIIYRLNRVPDKNYIEFLNLIGINLLPAQPARGVVTFKIVEGAREEDLIPGDKGIEVATAQTKTAEAIVFETEHEVNLTSIKIIKCCSKDPYGFSDHTESVLSESIAREPYYIFHSDTEIERIFYLGDNELLSLSEDMALRIYFQLLAEHAAERIDLDWEFWNGAGWESTIPLSDETKNLTNSGYVTFDEILGIEKTKVNEIESFWLRCRLVKVERGHALPYMVAIKGTAELKESRGLKPERGCTNIEEAQYLLIDFNRNFYPFDKLPRLNTTFYLASQEVLSRKNARISLEVTMSDFYTPLPFESLKQLKLAWEYRAQTKEWKILGITTPVGVEVGNFAFMDGTYAFTKTGSISFNCPPDISHAEIGEEKNYWIRARIIAGDYGTKTTTIRPPSIKTVFLKFSQELMTPQHCLAYNDFTFRDINKEMREKKITSFQPFKIHPELSPAFYLGFDRRFSNKLHRVYFWVAEKTAEEEGNRQRKKPEAGQQVVVWEYWSKEKKKWVNLKMIEDNTKNFTQAGDIAFIGPSDFGGTEVFDTKAYWIRARWEICKYGSLPKLRGINLNSVRVIQAKSFKDEILGSSNGNPNQIFGFSQAPILPDVEILVKEKETPTGKAVWTKWRQVANFFESKEDGRHYILDCQAGKVYFGDSRHGRIPPIDRNNIKCSWHRVGGGATGNVGAGTITVLRGSIPYIESITNLESASGGADQETVEEAKLRGPSTLKHRYRAVTKDDFEALTKEASNNVARARCLPTEKKPGEVTVIIVPESKKDRPSPSTELLGKVRDYLEQRRLITTKLKIVKPSYTKVSIKIDAAIWIPEHSSELKKKMEEELRNFLHPLRGGPKQKGWEFGRDVYISEIYQTLEGIEGINYVANLVLNDNPRLRKVAVPDNFLVYPGEIIINIISG